MHCWCQEQEMLTASVLKMVSCALYIRDRVTEDDPIATFYLNLSDVTAVGESGLCACSPSTNETKPYPLLCGHLTPPPTYPDPAFSVSISS
jgi:hypothetical protein